MNVQTLSQNLTGMQDDLACYLFDEAVVWFGSKVESKLSEVHTKTGKPIYTLENLLSERKRNPNLNELRKHFGNASGIDIS